MASPPPHLVRLPGTDWYAWRDAALRATGFDVAGLTDLDAPECARIADAHLDGTATAENYHDAHAAAAIKITARIRDLCAHPAFREAVAWQNPAMSATLRTLARGGHRSNSKLRRREWSVARYWQRYLAKAETIGFFGPVCWARLDDHLEPAMTWRAGPSLLRARTVYLESWALAALASTIAADPRAKAHLRPVLDVHLALVDGRLIDPVRAAAPLPRHEVALLQACDGTASAAEIAARATGGGLAGFRSADDVLLQLDLLAHRGIVRWDIDLPVALDAEDRLREAVAGIGDDAARHDATAALDRVCTARDAVAGAAGDPDGLQVALAALDREFGAVTGHDAHRLAGRTYAGRGVCFEDTVRDLDVTFGAPFLAAIATPLDIVLRIATWICAEIGRTYRTGLAEIVSELRDEHGAEVPFGHVWFLAQDLFYGKQRPVDDIVTRLRARWTMLTEAAARRDPGSRGTDLLAEVERLFPGSPAPWSAARLHSPDLQVSAAGPDAFAAGDFDVVLSELHVAWATNASGALVAGHPDPPALRRALREDLGRDRIHPLLPADWPRHSPRLAFDLAADGDAWLGFQPAPGGTNRTLVRIGELVVSSTGGDEVVRTADGRQWPLLEVFGYLLSELAVDLFKTVTGAPGPRVTIDRMVIARACWRTTVTGTGLTEATGGPAVFLTARSFRRRLDLPEQVFVKVDTETKPLFVDFRSPVHAESLASMLRVARDTAGPDAPVQVTEMLPGPDDAWVPDADGRRYVSEVRLHVRDGRDLAGAEPSP